MSDTHSRLKALVYLQIHSSPGIVPTMVVYQPLPAIAPGKRLSRAKQHAKLIEASQQAPG